MKFDLQNIRNQPIRSQEEIMASWEDLTPVVSVVCITYNHQLYIEDAIRSFLMQETNFPIEIIIHDDASMDATPQIVRFYANKYPLVIKPIFQKKNIYSKSPNSVFISAVAPACGDFIAVCEGDDFWIDSLKLQKQEYAIRSNPTASIIVHNGLMMVEKKNKIILFKNIRSKFEFDHRQILKERNQFALTASYFFKREVLEELPLWFDGAPYGDFFIEIYSQKIGRGVYLPDIMSVYRLGMSSGWTSDMNSNRMKIIKLHEKLLDIYERMRSDFPDSMKEIDFRKKLSILEILCNSIGFLDEERYLQYGEKLPPSLEKAVFESFPYLFGLKALKLIKFGRQTMDAIKRRLP